MINKPRYSLDYAFPAGNCRDTGFHTRYRMLERRDEWPGAECETPVGASRKRLVCAAISTGWRGEGIGYSRARMRNAVLRCV
jgi:hypothetical protein